MASVSKETASRASPTPSSAALFAPPPHSIAVLPFVNMSGDKEQEYFSDGLSEELLNSLARINELQVAARTSSFYFKGERVDLPTVAHKLNVASILEGSVRRSGNTIRITAQLNNALTGFHLWSQTYDRNLGDVLKLQTEIANAVANALKVTLLGDVAAKIEVGGTQIPAAFDAYLRGLRLSRNANDASNARTALWLADALQKARRYEESIPVYRETLGLDPRYLAPVYGQQGLSFYLLGDMQGAKTTCETSPQDWQSFVCLAVTYHKLRQRREAGAQIPKLVEVGARNGGSAQSLAYQFGQIDAQWGDKEKALEWLEKAVRVRDSGLPNLKTDPLLDPLRGEPRFQAIERALKFTN